MVRMGFGVAGKGVCGMCQKLSRSRLPIQYRSLLRKSEDPDLSTQGGSWEALIKEGLRDWDTFRRVESVKAW